jgi:hypothetical protein
LSQLQLHTDIPKSGDVELQMAPITEVAKYASTASLPFGKYPLSYNNLSYLICFQ